MRRVEVTILLDAAQLEALNALAVEHQISRAALVRRALAAYFASQKSERPDRMEETVRPLGATSRGPKARF